MLMELPLLGYDQVAPPLLERLPEPTLADIELVIVSVELTVWFQALSLDVLMAGMLVVTIQV